MPFDPTAVIEKYGQKPLMRNGARAPKHPSRVLIAGPSGCHKTTLLMEMLLGDEPNLMRFTRLYVCAKDLSEPYYVYLAELFERMLEETNERLEEAGEPPEEPFAFFTSNPLDIDIDAFDPNEQNFVVFDDCVLDLKGVDGKAVNTAFMRGRKKNASLIFITQDAYHRDIKFLRGQCDYFLLFYPGSISNVRLLASELGVGADKFMEKAREAWGNRQFVFVNRGAGLDGIRVGWSGL